MIQLNGAASQHLESCKEYSVLRAVYAQRTLPTLTSAGTLAVTLELHVFLVFSHAGPEGGVDASQSRRGKITRFSPLDGASSVRIPDFELARPPCYVVHPCTKRP